MRTKKLFSILALMLTMAGTGAWAQTTYYEKVTQTSGITDGDYLIVYEDGNVALNGALNGALNVLDAIGNTISVTIDNGKIASSTDVDAAVFTINTTNGTLKSAKDYYIGINNSNGLNQTTYASDYTNSFSIDDDGNAVIAAIFSGSTMTLRYNNTSNQNRFRYYKNSGQKAIQLYKKVASQGGGDQQGGSEQQGGGSEQSTYKATLAVGTADADKWTAKAGDATEFSALPLTGVAKGETITLTYSGTKRVKSITATVKQPVPVAFINDNRNNYIEKGNYFRCQLYNPWDKSTSAAINPADLQLEKGERLSVTFRLTGFTFTQTAKMVLCCNFGSEQGWEPDCFGYSRAISVSSNGTYTVSWTNNTDKAVTWSDKSALTMAMQYEGYASLSDTSAASLKAACEIVSIVIE